MKDNFQFDLEILKAETREGRPFVTIYATDTAPDKEGERCSEECLNKLVDQIRSGDVDLVNTHLDAIGFGRGADAHVVDASQFHPELTGHKALLVDVELDFDFPHAKALFAAAQDPKKRQKHGFSIGGRLNRANPKCVSWEKGKRVFNDLLLDHITTTRGNKAANGRAMLGAAVWKSLDVSLADEEALKAVQAPFTVRDLAAKFGFVIDANTVSKEVQSAYFEGETEESGKTKHQHSFYCRLDGKSGTLIGQTYSPTAGDRHAHLVDLLGDETTETSAPSRGDAHTHKLGIGTVKQITQDVFEKRVAEIDDAALRAKLLEGLPSAPTTIPPAPAGAPATPTSAPASAASPAAVAAHPAPAENLLPKEEIGFLRGMMELAKKTLGGGGPEKSLPEAMDDLATFITPDYAAKGGDLDVLAKSTLHLLSRVAGVQFDREAAAMRTVKLYDAIESVGSLKIMAKAVVEAPAVTVEDPAPTAPKVEAETPVVPAPTIAQEDTEMSPEKMTELVEKLAPVVTEKVSASLVETLRKEGVLPKVAVTTEAPAPAAAAPAVEAPKTAPDAPAAAPVVETPAAPAAAAAPEAPKATPEAPAPVAAAPATPAAPAAAAPVAEAPKVVPAADDVTKQLLDTLTSVNKTVKELGERIEKMEKQPTGRKSANGQEKEPTKEPKNGLFKGTILPASVRG